MIQVRPGIFETNSSSVHAITFCTKQEFVDFMDGKLIFDIYEGELVPASKTYNNNQYTYRELERIQNDDYCEGTASAELKKLSDGTEFGIVRYDRYE